MASKIVLITGANTGIGLEAVKALVKSDRAYTIVVGARSPSKAQDAIKSVKEEFPNSKSDLESLQIDLESDESITKAFEEFKAKHDKLDALVNNGGASFDYQFPDKLSLREVFNKAYDTNVSGTHVLTHTFAPLLIRSAEPRLLFVTSGLSSLDFSSRNFVPAHRGSDSLFPPGWPKKPARPDPNTGYRASKAALNMVALHWHWVLRADGVKVFTISPGFLATGLGLGNPEALRKLGAGQPSQGGEIMRSVIEGARDEDEGKVVTKDGVQSW